MARPRKTYSDKGFTADQVELRELCMSSLTAFVGLVAPHRLLAHCHLDLMKELEEESIENLLVLYPRGHGKSYLMGAYAAWKIIKNPDITIIYVSATASLAESQLNAIKGILDSSIARKYWPELLSQEEGKRSRWRSDEINTDHWKREVEAIRDPTIKAVGSGANITGFHCDELLLDDLVVYENSATKTEREKVARYFSLLTSILNPGGKTKVVGTRYHEKDLYNDLQEMSDSIYGDDGQVQEDVPMFKVMSRVVEEDGEFLWPRAKRKDGKYFGFDKAELSKIKNKYLDKAQYFSQYYNDASNTSEKRITNFNYYDRERLAQKGNTWYFGDKRLNVYAAIDFAATITKRSDYTAISVVGVDKDGIVYILEISRFKTEKISEMSKELTRLYEKWHWLKLKAETNAQQNLVVEQIKTFNRQNNIYYTIEKEAAKGDKSIRIMAALEPRYDAGTILHYRGGNCQVLEDELVASRPAHDDVSDSLASCMDIIITPSSRSTGNSKVTNLSIHPRYGGVS